MKEVANYVLEQANLEWKQRRNDEYRNRRMIDMNMKQRMLGKGEGKGKGKRKRKRERDREAMDRQEQMDRNRLMEIDRIDRIETNRDDYIESAGLV